MNRRLAIALGVLIAAILLAGAAYRFGHKNEENAAKAEQLQTVEKSIEQHDQVAEIGRTVERKTVARKRATEETFNGIHGEEIKYVRTHADADAVCSLDDDGLRLWRAANTGADTDTAGGGNGDVSGAAATCERPADGSAGEPYCDGRGVSPVPRSPSGADRLAAGDGQGSLK